jgi:hypothetical protein
VTVTEADVPAMFVALALMLVIPAETPVTGTLNMVAPVGKGKLEGTVAKLVLLELRLTTKPAGAALDKTNVRFCIEPAVRVKVFGLKLKLWLALLTLTLVEAVLKPGEPAVTVAVPKAKPVTVNDPPVPPLATVTVCGSASTVPDGVDFRFTLTPVAGAGAFNVKVPLMVPFNATDVESREIVIVGTITLTVAVPETNPVPEAVIVVDPVATPVTETLAVVPFATVTVAGTVAAPGLLLTSCIT